MSSLPVRASGAPPARRHAMSLALFLPLVLAAGLALAGEPLEWLARMSQAVDELNYTGTFIHLAGRESQASRVWHRAVGGSLAERVISLDGEMHEVVRTERETRCIIPAYGMVIIDPVGESSLRAALPDYQGGIDDHYHIARLGLEKVAGRRTQRIQVSPVDDYRFGYELWLDLETAMPLKTMTLSGGQVVELMHFTEIAFPAQIDDAELAPTLLGDDFTTHRPSLLRSPERLAEGADGGGERGWRAGRLPPGFRLASASRGTHVNGRVGEHLVYSDGLASVSVFIEHFDANAAPPRAMASFADLGASTAFSRVMGSYQIVVVGEVPADTVTLIGRSMRLRESIAR